MTIGKLLCSMPCGISVTVFDTKTMAHRAIEEDAWKLPGHLLRTPIRRVFWRNNTLVIFS